MHYDVAYTPSLKLKKSIRKVNAKRTLSSLFLFFSMTFSATLQVSLNSLIFNLIDKKFFFFLDFIIGAKRTLSSLFLFFSMTFSITHQVSLNSLIFNFINKKFFFFLDFINGVAYSELDCVCK